MAPKLMTAAEAKAMAMAGIPLKKIAAEVQKWIPTILSKVAAAAKDKRTGCVIKVGKDIVHNYPANWVEEGYAEIRKTLVDLGYQAEWKTGPETTLTITWG